MKWLRIIVLGPVVLGLMVLSAFVPRTVFPDND